VASLFLYAHHLRQASPFLLFRSPTTSPSFRPIRQVLDSRGRVRIDTFGHVQQRSACHFDNFNDAEARLWPDLHHGCAGGAARRPRRLYFWCSHGQDTTACFHIDLEAAARSADALEFIQASTCLRHVQYCERRRGATPESFIGVLGFPQTVRLPSCVFPSSWRVSAAARSAARQIYSSFGGPPNAVPYTITSPPLRAPQRCLDCAPNSNEIRDFAFRPAGFQAHGDTCNSKFDFSRSLDLGYALEYVLPRVILFTRFLRVIALARTLISVQRRLNPIAPKKCQP
ncbi:hypothetical protein C8R43DRAFT_1189876, partial [Mycena crocata]